MRRHHQYAKPTLADITIEGKAVQRKIFTKHVSQNFHRAAKLFQSKRTTYQLFLVGNGKGEAWRHCALLDQTFLSVLSDHDGNQDLEDNDDDDDAGDIIG